MDVLDDRPDVEEQDQAEDDQDQLSPEVGQGEQQIERARLLDSDDVEDYQKPDEQHRGCHVSFVRGDELKLRDVALKDAQVADREVRRDRDGGRVVEELYPAHEKPDRRVERPPGEVRAAARVWQR
jgi:hypothetical protein